MEQSFRVSYKFFRVCSFILITFICIPYLPAMSSDEKYDEPTLLSMLAQDSEYAFQLLFDRYRNRIYRTATLYVKSPILAEEIVQDVFLKVWFHRREITALRSFEAWLYTVSKNHILNCLKKQAGEWKARETWLRSGENSENFENNTDSRIRSAQFHQLLKEAISKLPTQQQRVYRLAKEENLTYEDIALQPDISPLTVKTHMSRALETIRCFLAGQGMLYTLLLIMQA